MIEIFYLSIYVFSLLIIGFATIITGGTYGEAIDVNINNIGISILLLVYLSTYIFFYCFYKKTQNNMLRIKKFPIFVINRRLIHGFYFICLLISFIGTYNYGVGKLEAEVTTNLGFLFNLIKFNEFFPIYYVAAREKNKNLYWINILFFCILRTTQGWTSWIMQIAVLELFFRCKEKGWIRRIFKLFKSKILAALGILCGTGLYYYVSPLKNVIREGGNLSHYKISLFETFMALVERFCNFAVYTSAWQNANKISSMYKLQNIFISEFKTLFIPLVPSFIMRNKDIRSLGNIVQWAMWPGMTNGTSTGYGFLMYWYTLLRCSIADFIVCASVSLILFILTCSILNGFDNEEHDIKIVYFIFLVSIANGSSIVSIFSYGYIGSLYLILVMILFGVIKIKIK